MTRRMKRRRARNARGRSRRSGAPPRGRSERHEIVPRGRARLDPFHNDVSAGGGIQTNRIIKIRDYTLSPFSIIIACKLRWSIFPSNRIFPFQSAIKHRPHPRLHAQFFPFLYSLRFGHLSFFTQFARCVLFTTFKQSFSKARRFRLRLVNLAIIKRGIWVGGVAELGRRYILDGCLIVDGLVTIERYPRPLLIMAPRWRYFGCRPKINKLMPDSKRRQGRDGSRAN